MCIVSRRRAYQRGKLFRLFTKNNCVLRCVPVFKRAADGRGPFERKVTDKASLYFQRLIRFNVQENDSTRFVRRNEQRLANAKRIADINQHRRGWSDGERSGEIFGWESAVRHMKGQMKIAKKFQRINPSLEPAGFVAEQAGAGANDGKKLPGANRSRQFDLRRLSSGKRNQQEH